MRLMQRIYHKDLIPVLPDNLLIFQLYDCLSISEELYFNGEPEDIITKKITKYMPDEFYTYFKLVCDEIIKRKINSNIQLDEFEENFVRNLSKYSGRETFSIIDYPRLFEGWHSTRYLQQCILQIEELYDNEFVELKDWFRLVNGVRNMSVLCEETFETLFT